MKLKMISLLGYLLLSYVATSIDSKENIALKKETFSSSVYRGAVSSRAVDGNRDGIYKNQHCMRSKRNGRQWLLVNLQAVYDIETIDIWSRTDRTRYGQMRNFSVYIGQKYVPCQDNLFNNYELCATFGNEYQPRRKSIECNKRGQYILVVKGYETSRRDTLIICELEATGKKVPNMDPFREPKMLELDDDLPKSMHKLAAHKAITQNVHDVEFHWNTVRIHALRDTVEPILWIPKHQMIFMAGAQLSKGRIIVITGSGVWKNVETQPNLAITRGVKKWLVGNENAPLIDMTRQSRLSDSRSGGILYVGYWQPQSKNRLKEAVQLVKLGKIGLILSLDDRNIHHFDFLLKEIGMYIASDSLDDPILYTHRIKIANMRNNPMFPIKTLLPSFSALIKYDDQITFALKKVPINRLRAIGLNKDYLKLWLHTYREIAEWKIPCERRPISSKEDKVFVTVYTNILLASELLIDSNVKAPGVELYPGDVQSPKLVTKKLKIIASIQDEYHSTGLYLPPGHTMTITIHSGTAEKWLIQIGCWSDDVYHKPDWTRYPLIYSQHHLPTRKIFSAFGGNILIKNLNIQTGDSIELTLSGVVEAPYFNLRDPQTVSNWMTRRNADAPWGEIVGDAVTFCLLSKTFRHWDTAYIKEFTDDTYDKIVKSNHHLLGTDWRKRRREFIVFDRQIYSEAYGQSGYPIMGVLPWLKTLNLERNKNDGNYGISHELGHNVQDMKFSFRGTMEVTNNIFVLWNNHYIWHLPVFKNDNGFLYIKYIKHYLINQKADYQYWSEDPFVALAIFPQMTNSFGWSLLKNVFRTYWDNNRQQPNTDEEKIDEWMKRASEAARFNLAPLFDFWGIPLSYDARKSVEKFPCFLPDDFITKAVPQRVDFILRKYSNRCVRRSSSKVPDIYGDVDLKPLKSNDVIVLY